ncbi:OmpH family outer membrane protein [Blattabacterium cuenoti]|uniref:OmpH family outer membrane protein n=1 Tax=Blattabacterium cuenoti TaxID=1653831 RepID=UPI00163BED94|nr:OmpH family outer membrane protein [Blattabacterium cuenoti]
MKKNTVFYFLLFLFLLSGYSLSCFAVECQKQIVCLNSSLIIEKLPEFSNAKKELARIRKVHENNLEKLAKEFQKKIDKFQKSKNQSLKKELEVMEAKIQAYQQTAADDIENNRLKLLGPVYKKIENAIYKVINNNKEITRVDDCSPGKGILINKGKDITEEVKRELKIK